jgi:hypothetical protein
MPRTQYFAIYSYLHTAAYIAYIALAYIAHLSGVMLQPAGLQAGQCHKLAILQPLNKSKSPQALI